MSLFQHSVIKKYTQELDKVTVNKAFERFTKYFGNPEIQHNIRDSKEEQYQEGFLRSLFVEILGYTLNPEPNFNLLTEQKNEKDSKKADAAILLQSNLAGFENLRGLANKVIAVIELKGTDTTDLSKVENQAFSYKNNQQDCVYVITSNFVKLRFYIDNAIDFEEFNLFNLTPERFALLYLCLAKDNLLNNIPHKIKEASITHEEQITKQLYADYSGFKRFLFENITSLNPQFDKLTLFKKTQKLLDRFLFILFAEDRLLLPPNSIREIIKQWEQLKELDNYIPLYERFIKYFGYMNVGFKGKQYEIFAYNGGLFEPDKILDNIKIDDTILYEHTIRLSKYDFDTEVDVNILGHIFEHSLNEIEEIQAEIEGKEPDKTKTKRKKEGIFYTPKYITKYIVENTIGVLCTEKKTELGINDENFSKVSNFGKVKKKELIEKIDTYRNWLLKLTICDPACGSGAFLNQALDFLITEHSKLDELKARITNSSIVFSDIENDILEHNIFGVDLNEEAVEIAKLSLWLKTAHKGRKLSILSSNIKCGNSLIDDPNVAGEKAFNWFLEFPQVFPHYKKPKPEPIISVPEPGDREYIDEMQEPSFSYKTGSKGFEKHGFDVIIGNPPYVVLSSPVLKNYKYTIGNNNTYVAFVELAFKISKKSGELGFIIPNTWFAGDNFLSMRNNILKEFNLKAIIQLPYDIFQAYIDTSIVLFKNNTGNNDTLIYKYDIRDFQNSIDISKLENFPTSEWYRYGKIFLNNNLIKLGNKVWFSDKNILLGNISKINRGCLPPKEIEKSKIKTEKYNIKWFDEQVFRYKVQKQSDEESFVDYENLRENKPIELYKTRKILARQLMSRQFRMNLTITEEEFAFKKNLYAIYDISNSFLYEYILAILNSNLFSFIQVNFNTSLQRDDFPSFSLQDFKNFPIPNILIKQQEWFKPKVSSLMKYNNEISNVCSLFLKTLKEEKEKLKITNKIEAFYTLSYEKFKKELTKQKIEIKLGDENNQWREYFEKEKAKAFEIQNEINKTDKEIDEMVYQLYNLTKEEIKIVEGE